MVRFVAPLALASLPLATLTLPAAAQPEDRQAKQFATGSGKVDAGTLDQHLSFTAHSDGAATFGNCLAHGNLEYKQKTAALELHLKAKVTRLVILLRSHPTLGPVQTAFIVGEVQFYSVNGQQTTPPAQYAWFDVVDSGQPGGTGDQIRFEGFQTFDPCFGPFFGTPITHGNVLIQSTGSPLP